jgi:mRNA interferase MazF
MVARGDVFVLRADRHARGHELRGARYAVAVQSPEFDLLSTLIVAPTSRSARGASFRPEVEIGGEGTRVMVEHLAAVDYDRLGELRGRLTGAEMESVDDALRLVLGLD